MQLARQLFGWKQRARLARALRASLGAINPYGKAFYEMIDRTAQGSAVPMARSIASEFQPMSAVDVGCGAGWLLAELRGLGCHDVFGYEASRAGLRQTRAKRVPAGKLDLSRPYQSLRRFDVCCCFEVAEHLDAAHADNIVRILTGFAPIVVFSAATPGQGGVDHRNEQPHDYWIERFDRCGYAHALDTTTRFRAAWTATPAVADWYSKNVMAFRAAA